MENNQTLTHLYSKGRNRFAKVVYALAYALILIILIGGIFDNFPRDLGVYIIYIISFVVIFEFIRRAFYYIALGTITPKK